MRRVMGVVGTVVLLGCGGGGRAPKDAGADGELDVGTDVGHDAEMDAGLDAGPGRSPRPNIVIIYADDLGFGDVGVYGARFGTPSPAPTPRVDALAAEGLLFTQAHSSNGVCTPSRYALLTGKYNWRTFSDVSWGYAAPDIPSSDTTLAEFLKAQGYATAAFGKWHLGGFFYDRSGVPYTARSNDISDPARVD